MLRKYLASLILMMTTPALAVEVKVGAYEFPPYVTDQGGVSQRFIEFLNSNQGKYNFSLVRTTAKGRYDDLKSKKFDLILFEDKSWGWKDQTVDVSSPFHSDATSYVALKDTSRNQSFFNAVTAKSLIVVRGYHYGFAQFNADEIFLKQHFKIEFADTPQAVLESLFLRRGDIAVTTKSYLKMFTTYNPEASPKLLISEKPDQQYQLSAVIRKNGPINKSDFDRIIRDLKKSGKLKDFFDANEF